MIIRNRNSKKDLQYNGQKRANEQKWFQIHYTDTKVWNKCRHSYLIFPAQYFEDQLD
jgi:hypothetical protein